MRTCESSGRELILLYILLTSFVATTGRLNLMSNGSVTAIATNIKIMRLSILSNLSINHRPQGMPFQFQRLSLKRSQWPQLIHQSGFLFWPPCLAQTLSSLREVGDIPISRRQQGRVQALL